MRFQYIILGLPADPQQYRTEYCYISCLATIVEKRDRFPHLNIQFPGLRNHNALVNIDTVSFLEEGREGKVEGFYADLRRTWTP